MARTRMPDVIVLLPGILGSVLRKDGKDVWAASVAGVLTGLLSRGNSIRELTLAEDSLEEDLGDGVTADRLIPDLHLVPRLWKIDGYTKIRQQIQVAFDVTEGENYFEFPYDWRRNNLIAAQRLQKSSHEWLKNWRSHSGNSEAKLILVAHSMGGLVARYYLEVLDGWRDTKALITFGTPYRGALGALDALANGVKKGPFDFSEFARSLTSVYQLLPIYPCYDSGEGGLVRIGETSGIPNVDEQKAKDALVFHHEIMDRVDERVRHHDPERDGYEIFPIVGTEQPTLQSARRDGDVVELLEEYEGEDQKGDGTVPRVSATPHELSKDPRGDMYAATRHASLQNADPVLVHMWGVITRLYLNLGKYRNRPNVLVTPPAKLSLRIEDVYLSNEPVVVQVQPDREGLDLEVTITEVYSDAVVARGPLGPLDGGWRRADFAPLAEGVYRVKVGETAVGVEPVADVFAVVGQH